MSSPILRNPKFIKKLCKCSSNKLFKSCSKDELKTTVDLLYNAMIKRIPVSKNVKNNFKKYENKFLYLIDPAISLKKKRKFLVQSGGTKGKKGAKMFAKGIADLFKSLRSASKSLSKSSSSSSLSSTGSSAGGRIYRSQSVQMVNIKPTSSSIQPSSGSMHKMPSTGSLDSKSSNIMFDKSAVSNISGVSKSNVPTKVTAKSELSGSGEFYKKYGVTKDTLSHTPSAVVISKTSKQPQITKKGSYEGFDRISLDSIKANPVSSITTGNTPNKSVISKWFKSPRGIADTAGKKWNPVKEKRRAQQYELLGPGDLVPVQPQKQTFRQKFSRSKAPSFEKGISKTSSKTDISKTPKSGFINKAFNRSARSEKLGTSGYINPSQATYDKTISKGQTSWKDKYAVKDIPPPKPKSPTQKPFKIYDAPPAAQEDPALRVWQRHKAQNPRFKAGKSSWSPPRTSFKTKYGTNLEITPYKGIKGEPSRGKYSGPSAKIEKVEPGFHTKSELANLKYPKGSIQNLVTPTIQVDRKPIKKSLSHEKLNLNPQKLKTQIKTEPTIKREPSTPIMQQKTTIKREPTTPIKVVHHRFKTRKESRRNLLRSSPSIFSIEQPVERPSRFRRGINYLKRNKGNIIGGAIIGGIAALTAGASIGSAAALQNKAAQIRANPNNFPRKSTTEERKTIEKEQVVEKQKENFFKPPPLPKEQVQQPVYIAKEMPLKKFHSIHETAPQGFSLKKKTRKPYAGLPKHDDVFQVRKRVHNESIQPIDPYQGYKSETKISSYIPKSKRVRFEEPIPAAFISRKKKRRYH